MISTMSWTIMGFVLVHPVGIKLSKTWKPLLGYILLLMLIFIAREGIFMLCSWTCNVWILASISQSTCKAVRIQLFRERLSDKCTWQVRKVLWMVLSSPFFKEILRNVKTSHRRMLVRDKGSNKSRLDSYIVRNRVLIISHITFRDCRVHTLSDNLLEIALYKVVLTQLLFTFVRNLLIFPNRKSKLGKSAPWL